MKLDELKAKVYTLTGVNTTRQLKIKYPELKTLDMRRKASWEKALTIVQPADEFQNWLANPPEEYKALFSDIEIASEEYSKQLTEVKQPGKEMTAIADDLEELAGEYQDEADLMKREVKATRRIKKQAQLN